MKHQDIKRIRKLTERLEAVLSSVPAETGNQSIDFLFGRIAALNEQIKTEMFSIRVERPEIPEDWKPSFVGVGHVR